VYVYVDPRTDEPFYVGKGAGERFIQHLNPSVLKKSSPVCDRLLEITEAGFQAEVYIVAENLSDEEAVYLEGFYINSIGRLNDYLNPGPLVNIVRSGGEGRSGYRGVQKKYRSFKAHINVGGKYNHLGYFDSVEDAARAVDQALVKRDGEKTIHHRLNFPEEWNGTTCLRPLIKRRTPENGGKHKGETSRYIGVAKACKSRMKKVQYSDGWVARYYHDGKCIECGPYREEEIAARKRDELSIKFQGPEAALNFPDEWEGLECLRMSVEEAGRAKSRRTSQ
jgi:hypothetical protein